MRRAVAAIVPSPGATDRRLVILVVDEGTSRTQHFDTLTFLGFRVAEADHGADAVSRARRLRPDAIVLNASDPEKGAWNTASMLKSDPMTSRAWLIAVADASYEKRARRIGVDIFAATPCAPATLAELIARHRGTRRP
jgi:CheY-like chemotaxis protein